MLTSNLVEKYRSFFAFLLSLTSLCLGKQNFASLQNADYGKLEIIILLGLFELQAGVNCFLV